MEAIQGGGGIFNSVEKKRGTSSGFVGEAGAFTSNSVGETWGKVLMLIEPSRKSNGQPTGGGIKGVESKAIEVPRGGGRATGVLYWGALEASR